MSVRRLPRIGRRPFRTISYLVVLAVYLLLRIRRYDLAHVHLANLQADVVVFVGKLVRRPVYVKLAAGGPVGEVGRMRRVAWATRYFGFRHASRVQVLSEEIRCDLESLGIHGSHVVRIPNGFDTRTFRPPSPEEVSAARRRLDLPAETLLVLFVGRFARYKGILDLMEAWRDVGREGATLVVVGTHKTDQSVGPLPTVQAMTEREWSNDVGSYYHACDVFVLPSHAEGMSNALLEAMACGMSVVATRVGAAQEMVEPSVSGLLVDAGETDQLAGALRKLIEDAHLRRRLGQEATRSIHARYSIVSVVDRIEAEYQAMVR